MYFFAIGLFTNAEVPEDVVEGVLRGDGLAEDGIESLDDGTEIFGNEVAAFVRLPAYTSKRSIEPLTLNDSSDVRHGRAIKAYVSLIADDTAAAFVVFTTILFCASLSSV